MISLNRWLEGLTQCQCRTYGPLSWLGQGGTCPPLEKLKSVIALKNSISEVSLHCLDVIGLGICLRLGSQCVPRFCHVHRRSGAKIVAANGHQ